MRVDTLRVRDSIEVAGCDARMVVYAFTHANIAAQGLFVNLSTKSGSNLTLSSGHYLYVDGALTAAGVVRASDVVELANGRWDTVAEVLGGPGAEFVRAADFI